ncbi:hypothetical protein [Thalassospira sp. ER-Se-21-Dark]|uniref:hypothetical protein n=1 Tax=Thalassospira sp. ER-Se-21-Dark TaxID=2585190 RepID=UPI001B3045FF|nr:hypothetical protein [Thalassospira sp. ER-Se-21-Dark]MBP3126247.1 hypothetical protein [Thalassospira sp. ER-Se-21-Dark]
MTGRVLQFFTDLLRRFQKLITSPCVGLLTVVPVGFAALVDWRYFGYFMVDGTLGHWFGALSWLVGSYDGYRTGRYRYAWRYPPPKRNELRPSRAYRDTVGGVFLMIVTLFLFAADGPVSIPGLLSIGTVSSYAVTTGWFGFVRLRAKKQFRASKSIT